MKHLPFFYYPTTWLCLDDDFLMTASLSSALSQFNYIKSFHSPNACINFLGNYKSFLADQSFLHANTKDENYGTLEYASVDFNVTDIVKLADLPERHGEITSIVMDYRMPEMNGFSFSEKCTHISIPRILLTGEAKSNETIDGFNDNLIHYFIEKGDEYLFEKLSGHLKKFTYQYFQKKTFPLLHHLEADKPIPLSDPTFVDFFDKYCQEYGIKEYYLIDKQGSFLCIDSKGKRFCFVVQTENSIDEWLDLYERESNGVTEQLIPIKEREKIPFFGIGLESWRVPFDQWPQHYYTANLLEGRERYFWAHVDH